MLAAASSLHPPPPLSSSATSDGATASVSFTPPPTTTPSTATTSSTTTTTTALATSTASSTSLFSVKLQREIGKSPDSQWRAAFIDYQRLRKQIKKIVYYEQEAKHNANNSPPHSEAAQRNADTQPTTQSSATQSTPPAASSAQSSSTSVSSSPSASFPVSAAPSSLLPPLPSTSSPSPSLSVSSAQRDRLRKSRDVFWCVLKAEIEKVNAFFTLKEAEANRQFKAVGLDSDSPSEQSATSTSSSSSSSSSSSAAELSTDRLIFGKLLLEQHPRALAECLLPPPLFDSASAVSWSALPASRVSLLTSFLSLCAMLDQLRKFVVINYVVVLKVLKKYDEYTIRTTKDELSRELSDEPFATSARLASLLQRAEKITFRLLPPMERQANKANTQQPNSTTDGAANNKNTTDTAAASSQQAMLSSSSTSDSSPSFPLSSLCPICHFSLANPVQLQCSHRCCFNCLASNTVARSFSCPVCAKQQEFDSLDLGLESVLTKFAGVSLTDRERMEGEKNAYSNTQQMQQQQHAQPTLDTLARQVTQPHHLSQSSVQIDSNSSALQRVKTELMGGEIAGDVQSAAASSLMSVDYQQYGGVGRAGAGMGRAGGGSADARLAADELLMAAKDEAGMESSSDDDDDSEGSPTDGSVHPSRGKHGGGDGAHLGSDHKKSGRGSCHQCKTTRESKMLLCCTSKAEKGKRKRKCRKKYCSACFPEHDTRVLTSSGFLFLTEIEARINAEQPLLYACYDKSEQSIVYRPGRPVVVAPPTRWVDFTQARTRPMWNDGSDDYGTAPLNDDGRANRLTLRTTPDHDMYVQLCTSSAEDGERQYESRKDGGASLPPHKMRAEELAPGYQCDCSAVGRTCAHGYSHYRMYTGAASGLQPSAHVISLIDRDLHSPIAALGLRTMDELDAFLELFGYWLGDGSMSYDTRNSLTSANAVLFNLWKENDRVYLLDLLARLHLERDQHLTCNENEVRVLDSRWFHFFDDEFGVKYSNSRHYDRRLALLKQGMHSTQRRPSIASSSESGSADTSVSVASSTRALSASANFSLSASASVEQMEDEDEPMEAGEHEQTKVEEGWEGEVEVEDESAKSAEWLPEWVLFLLDGRQLRLVIEGLRQADGRSAVSPVQWQSAKAGGNAIQGEHKICTSSLAFRDQLVHACLHAGYSAYFELNSRAGEVYGTYTEEEMEAALRVDSTRQLKVVRSRHDSWWVCYSELVSEVVAAQDVRFDGSDCIIRQKSPLQHTAAIATLPGDRYDRVRDGRVWCVKVEHDDHLIFVQRAHCNDSGVVTKVGRAILAGNCLQRTYAQVMASMTPAEIAKWQCPACVGICTCAACQRRGKETALENVGLPPPLNIPAELLANDPWAYALHASSTAAQQAQQAAAAAAAALQQQQQHIQQQQQQGMAATGPALLNSLNGGYIHPLGFSAAGGVGGIDSSSNLLLGNSPLSQLHQSLAILQSLAAAPQSSSPSSSLSASGPLSGLSGLSAGQLQALNAAAAIQMQHNQLNQPPPASSPQHHTQPPLDSIMGLQLQQHYQQQQQQQQQKQQQQAAVFPPSSSIPSSELLAAQEAAASSRERQRHSHSTATEQREHDESTRVSKLNAAGLSFPTPPPFFMSSHTPASPLLHSPTLSRPASPLSPLSPSSSSTNSPSNSPQVRQRTLASLHKLSTSRNLSLSVPSKTRSISIGVAVAHPSNPANDDHSQHHSHHSHHSHQQHQSHHPHTPQHSLPSTAQRVSPLPPVDLSAFLAPGNFSHSSSAAPSLHSAYPSIVTAVGGDDMPAFHTGSNVSSSATSCYSVPSRTRTISDRSTSRPRSSSGRRSVEHSNDADSPHSPYSPVQQQQQHSSSQHSIVAQADFNNAYQPHLTHLQSMSSRNPNKSILQQQQHMQLHNQQQQQQLQQQAAIVSPSYTLRRASFGSSSSASSASHPDVSSVPEASDEPNGRLQQLMELETAHRLQLQLLQLQNAQQQHNTPQHSEAGEYSAHSRQTKQQRAGADNEQLALHNSNALSVLENYTQMQQQQQQQHAGHFFPPSAQQQLSSLPPFSAQSAASYPTVASLPSYGGSSSVSHQPFSSSVSLPLLDDSSSSALFDRQSSFQLPDDPMLQSFNARDSSMSIEPRGLSALVPLAANEANNNNTPQQPQQLQHQQQHQHYQQQQQQHSRHSHHSQHAAYSQQQQQHSADPSTSYSSSAAPTLPSSDGMLLGSAASSRLHSSNIDNFLELPSASTMDMQREVSLTMGMGMGMGLGMGLGMGMGGMGMELSFDRSISALMNGGQSLPSQPSAQYGSSGDSLPSSAASHLSSPNPSLSQLSSNASTHSSASHHTASALSPLDDDLQNELFTLQHDGRGVSAAAFDQQHQQHQQHQQLDMMQHATNTDMYSSGGSKAGYSAHGASRSLQYGQQRMHH